MIDSSNLLIDKIEVSRSANRVKTVSAALKGNTLYVRAPLNISEKALQKVISNLKERFLKSKLKRELNRKYNLKDTAEMLNKKYFEGKLKINSVRYSTGQNSRYGSCNYKTGDIFISYRLSAMPDWVRDYVIVHELVHLIEPNHGRYFHEIVSRYPLAERAKGFLMAKGFEEEKEESVQGINEDTTSSHVNPAGPENAFG